MQAPALALPFSLDAHGSERWLPAPISQAPEASARSVMGASLWLEPNPQVQTWWEGGQAPSLPGLLPAPADRLPP